MPGKLKSKYVTCECSREATEPGSGVFNTSILSSWSRSRSRICMFVFLSFIFFIFFIFVWWQMLECFGQVTDPGSGVIELLWCWTAFLKSIRQQIMSKGGWLQTNSTKISTKSECLSIFTRFLFMTAFNCIVPPFLHLFGWKLTRG